MFFSVRLAQRPRDGTLVRFQFVFYSLCSVAGVVGLWFADFGGLFPLIFPEQERGLVYMAVVFALLLWCAQVLQRMTDAFGLTVPSEIARIIQRVIGLLIVYGIVRVGGVTLQKVFIYHYVVTIGLAVALWEILRRGAFRHWSDEGTRWGGFRGHLTDLRQYATPLLALSVVALLAGLGDRWILQTVGSSVEQGFFSLASQVSAVCFLFVGAMVPLLTREFSIMHAEQNLDRLRSAFARFLPMFYFLAAALSCFAALHSPALVALLGGSAYGNAVPAVAVMSIYPIHQTQGQLSGILLLATGDTKLYSVIGAIFLLAGLPMAYFSVQYGVSLGPGGGAAALAVKMVVIQAVAVNVQLYFAAKRLSHDYWPYLVQQVSCLGVLLVLAVGARQAGLAALGGGSSILPLAASAAVYASMCGGVAHWAPHWFGLSRTDVARAASWASAAVAWVKTDGGR
jgi:O-antigen/teichoic acid export membrane protein